MDNEIGLNTTGFAYPKDVKSKLPAWAKIEKDSRGEIIELDSAVVFPKFLKLLGLSPKPEKITRAEYDVTRIIIIMFIRSKFLTTEKHPEQKMRLRILSREEWRIKGKPAGHGDANPVKIYNKLDLAGKFDKLAPNAKKKVIEAKENEAK